jgi:hypothetical protein
LAKQRKRAKIFEYETKEAVKPTMEIGGWREETTETFEWCDLEREEEEGLIKEVGLCAHFRFWTCNQSIGETSNEREDRQNDKSSRNACLRFVTRPRLCCASDHPLLQAFFIDTDKNDRKWRTKVHVRKEECGVVEGRERKRERERERERPEVAKTGSGFGKQSDANHRAKSD